MLQNSYWRGNIRQLKNLAEQIAVIEMDHQINAETLSRYLPREENRQEIVLRNEAQPQAGKDYSHEIGILYNMLMKTQQELRELQERLGASHTAAQPLITSAGEPAAQRIIQRPADTEEWANGEVVDDEPAPAHAQPKLERMEDIEREQIKRTLEENNGNRKVTAARLGISERTLYRKIKEFGL